MLGIRFTFKLPRTCPLLLVVSLLFLAGCAAGNLIVVDENGLPVTGAQVMVIGASNNGEPSFTNDKGVASLNKPARQNLLSISISKTGMSSALVAYPNRLPIEVTLRRDE